MHDEKLYTYPLPSKVIQGYVVTHLSTEIQRLNIKCIICRGDWNTGEERQWGWGEIEDVD